MGLGCCGGVLLVVEAYCSAVVPTGGNRQLGRLPGIGEGSLCQQPKMRELAGATHSLQCPNGGLRRGV